MRIGLLTDTHIPVAAEALPTEVLEAFSGVDLILHAGDIYSFSVLDELECVAPVLAARGDDDWGPHTSKDDRVKEAHAVELGGITIWLAHEIFTLDLESHGNLQSVREKKRQGMPVAGYPDVVVFGHWHRPSVEYSDDILFVNSGSPTLLEYRKGLGTVGILTIDSGKVDAQIIRLQ